MRELHPRGPRQLLCQSRTKTIKTGSRLPCCALRISTLALPRTKNSKTDLERGWERIEQTLVLMHRISLVSTTESSATHP